MKNSYADCVKWVQLERVQKFSLIEQTDFSTYQQPWL